MENLTHSLAGAIFAEMAVPDGASRATRRLFLAAGVIAANAPDLDLLYVGITPFPLGYLLHHRGHTHTVVGLVVQAVLIGLACLAVMRTSRFAADRQPADRHAAAGHAPGAGVAWRARMWALVAVGLASHVALDACNNYGVHPFAPLDAAWYFGDTLFIFEPWLWVMLGVPLAMNARRRLSRTLLIVPLTALLGALAAATAIGVLALIGLLSAGAAMAWASRSWRPATRAAGAVVASLAFVAGMAVLSNAAAAATRGLLAGEARGPIVDVVLTPNPASPACWGVIAIERDDVDDWFVMRRGTLSLAPWQRPEACASHRLMGMRETRRAGGGRLIWSEEIRQPLGTLRAAARDCWVAAWLQFGRAPVLTLDRIYDLRFSNGPRDNFSTMSLRQAVRSNAGGGSCPANPTHWAMPRADLLQPAIVRKE